MDGGVTLALWHLYHLCALCLELRPVLREAIDRYRTLLRLLLQLSFR
jgi:hypothetical protein